MTVSAIPDGFRSVTPCLSVPEPAAVIRFASQAFDAVEEHRSADPSGAILEAQMRIGDSVVMLHRSEGAAAMPASLYLYVEDADAVFARAVQAGAEPVCEPEDAAQGDRRGSVRDVCGNQWWIATRRETVPPDEQMRRQGTLAGSAASSGDASEPVVE